VTGLRARNIRGQVRDGPGVRARTRALVNVRPSAGKGDRRCLVLATDPRNRTDGVPSVPPIPLRYVLALLATVTHTLKPFLARKGASPADVERMHQAWVRSVLLQVILWSEPYVRDGHF
jgi:hypothetical protein